MQTDTLADCCISTLAYYYNFYGYERFKACFGLEKRDDGTVVRKNRILLNHLKNPLLYKKP